MFRVNRLETDLQSADFAISRGFIPRVSHSNYPQGWLRLTRTGKEAPFPYLQTQTEYKEFQTTPLQIYEVNFPSPKKYRYEQHELPVEFVGEITFDEQSVVLGGQLYSSGHMLGKGIILAATEPIQDAVSNSTNLANL